MIEKLVKVKEVAPFSEVKGSRTKFDNANLMPGTYTDLLNQLQQFCG